MIGLASNLSKGPNSLPFVQSLAGGGASLYFPSTWTHSSSRPEDLEVFPEEYRYARQNTDLHSEKDAFNQAPNPYNPIPQENLGIPPTTLQPSPRNRRVTQPPPSPSLPVVSPNAPSSHHYELKHQLSGIWRDLADVKSLNTQEFWLVLYFVFNLSLTLCNKTVLVNFPFPYTLTAIHALCGALGGWILWAQGAYVPKRLRVADSIALTAFSILYSMNIAVSNVSLNMVTIPFHQIVRATTPIFTIVLSTTMFGTQFTTRKLITLIPVMVGVGFATYGDYYATIWGLLLTLFGTFLASLKTIFTNVLQSSPSQLPSKHYSNFLPPALSLHPLDLLTRMCPLAFVQCVIFAQINGELDGVRQWSAQEMTWLTLTGLLINGCIAFGLNVVSFTANKKAGALSMTVAANIKQVLTILSAVLLFNLHITLTNGAGIAFTLFGGAWYGYVDYDEKRHKRDRERLLNA